MVVERGLLNLAFSIFLHMLNGFNSKIVSAFALSILLVVGQ